jgi:hypothetical protein
LIQKIWVPPKKDLGPTRKRFGSHQKKIWAPPKKGPDFQFCYCFVAKTWVPHFGSHGQKKCQRFGSHPPKKVPKIWVPRPKQVPQIWVPPPLLVRVWAPSKNIWVPVWVRVWVRVWVPIYSYIVCPSGPRRPPHDRMERNRRIKRFGYFGELCVCIFASCPTCWLLCPRFQVISSSRELLF